MYAHQFKVPNLSSEENATLAELQDEFILKYNLEPSLASEMAMDFLELVFVSGGSINLISKFHLH